MQDWCVVWYIKPGYQIIAIFVNYIGRPVWGSFVWGGTGREEIEQNLRS